MPNSGRAVDSAVRAILAQDPIWAAYAIADLRPDKLDEILLQGVAAIGNVYTRPDCRRRGYGMAVTVAIMQALQEDGYGQIVLNVSRNNTAAQSLYKKTRICQSLLFLEGCARKNSG